MALSIRSHVTDLTEALQWSKSVLIYSRATTRIKAARRMERAGLVTITPVGDDGDINVVWIGPVEEEDSGVQRERLRTGFDPGLPLTDMMDRMLATNSTPASRTQEYVDGFNAGALAMQKLAAKDVLQGRIPEKHWKRYVANYAFGYSTALKHAAKHIRRLTLPAAPPVTHELTIQVNANRTGESAVPLRFGEGGPVIGSVSAEVTPEGVSVTAIVPEEPVLCEHCGFSLKMHSLDGAACEPWRAAQLDATVKAALGKATGLPPERIHTGRHPLDMD